MTFLNHWGQVVQICFGVIGTGNDMLAIQYQAITQSSRKTFLATSPVGLVSDQAH